MRGQQANFKNTNNPKVMMTFTKTLMSILCNLVCQSQLKLIQFID